MACLGFGVMLQTGNGSGWSDALLRASRASGDPNVDIPNRDFCGRVLPSRGRAFSRQTPRAGRCSVSAAGLSLGVLGENSELGSATSSWRLEGAVLARRVNPTEATLFGKTLLQARAFCLLANAFLISSVLLIFFFSLSWGWSVSRCFSGFLHCNDGTIT